MFKAKASGVPKFTITEQCGREALQCPTTVQPGGRDSSIPQVFAEPHWDRKLGVGQRSFHQGL